MTAAAGDYAPTRYGRVYFRSVGQGKPLLMLHATPRSSRSFDAVVPELAKHFQVIAPDTLGFGYSAPLPKDCTVEMLADAMEDVLTFVDAQPAAVFGLHTGNKIAVALGTRHAQSITSVILCGMTHSLILDRQERESAIREVLAANPIRTDEVSNPSEREDRRRATGTREIYEANYGFDFALAVSNIQVPVLVVELATEAEKHLGLHGPALASLTPAGRALVLERSDRDVLERYPSELCEPIIAYLQ